jgi:multiple sugar transport system substrate-binding protein
MKRITFVLVTLCALAGFSFAGGQQDVEDRPVTLTFYHYASQTHLLYINPLKEGFQKAYPNITIQSVEVAKGGYEALAQKILLGLAAGDPPDVGQVGYTYLRTMVESEACLALDDFMEADAGFDRNNLFPAMMGLGESGGKQYLIPIGTSTPTMFNNVELFTDSGLDVEKPPKSWANARAAAVKLKEHDHMGIFWGWQITGNWIFQSMVENLGGKLANSAGTAVAFDDGTGLQALEYLADLTSNDLMPKTDQGLSTFVAGNLGMWVDSSFQRVNTPKQAAFTVRMSPMPTPDGSPPKVPAGGNGAMMFTKEASKQDAAWKFIRYIAETEGSRAVADNSGYTPANQKVIADLKRENADDINYKVVLDQAARVIPWYSWPGKNSGKIAQILKEMQEAVVYGEKSPKTAISEAAAEVNALLK